MVQSVKVVEHRIDALVCLGQGFSGDAQELYRYRSFGDARLSPIGQSHPRVDPKDFP